MTLISTIKEQILWMTTREINPRARLRTKQVSPRKIRWKEFLKMMLIRSLLKRNERVSSIIINLSSQLSQESRIAWSLLCWAKMRLNSRLKALPQLQSLKKRDQIWESRRSRKRQWLTRNKKMMKMTGSMLWVVPAQTTNSKMKQEQSLIKSSTQSSVSLKLLSRPR